MIHELSLLRRGNQVGNGVNTDRHVGKEPSEFCTPFNHAVYIFFAAYRFRIFSRIAAGSAENKLFLF